jgi:hypothetical protein
MFKIDHHYLTKPQFITYEVQIHFQISKTEQIFYMRFTKLGPCVVNLAIVIC